MGKKKRFPWAAFLGATSATATAIAGIIMLRQRAPNPIKNLALIGDSYAVGLGPRLEQFFPSFRYEGHEGTNTWQWAHHSPKCGQCGDWLTAFHPEVVLVSLGVNDGATPNPENYHAIIRELHGIGARVVWIEPPADVNTPSKAVIASLGVQTIPSMEMPLAPDRLHPASYEPWAEEIAKVLS